MERGCSSGCLYQILASFSSLWAGKNMQVQLIPFRKNIDFIDVGNFEVGNFRDRRVYEIGLIAIRDMSPLFCGAME